ncbi:MAG TPA: nucleotidyltransferase family protein, partial [Candidatus Baltobacteraceae bacterium]
ARLRSPAVATLAMTLGPTLAMTHRLTAVILAAGTGSRFGGQKLLVEIAGKAMIARVLAAVAHLPTVVVGPRDLEPRLSPARLIENDAPERGMAHSLRLANAAIGERKAIVVLLADMPFMTRAIVDAVVGGAGNADVCYPQRAGVGGHPVLFSAHARTKIAALRDGDTLRSLRDDPSLTRRTIDVADDGAYRDVDRASDI